MLTKPLMQLNGLLLNIYPHPFAVIH
jgi:hypothetical protein